MRRWTPRLWAMVVTLNAGRGETWDRSHRLMAWSRVLLSESQRLVRPVLRGASDNDRRMIRVSDLTGIRIIVVDDNEDNADLLATFLGSCGATVLTARSGAEALGYLDARPAIDLLLTDLAMPGLNGIELVKRVRAHPRHAALPAVAVSGYPESYFAGDAERFSAFILKPVDVDALAATVKNLVAVPRHNRR
jgi:CheY-like chemotaxis protein